MRELWARFRAWIAGRRGLSEELEEEMNAHLAMDADDRADRGMSRDAAQQAARARFGNRTSIAEKSRESWGFPALDSILSDIVFAIRGMRRTPAFALVVILTLALGIGLNTAIFSAVHAVLLKPLPYPESERLVWLGEATARAFGISVTWV